MERIDSRKMKFFILLCISTSVIANSVEERCVRLQDCPPLIRRFKDQGPSVLRNYQTCGPIKVVITVIIVKQSTKSANL